MRRFLMKFGLLAAVAMLAATVAQPAQARQTSGRAARAAAEVAYFEFAAPPHTTPFVIKLTDPAKIAHARAILSGEERERIHVYGRIIPRPAPYNPRWDFHLSPDTIDFFQVAIEVCDATTDYVNDHLDEAGGAFLPGYHWCPWTSRLLREISAP